MPNPILLPHRAQPLPRSDRAPLVVIVALVVITLLAYLGGGPAPEAAADWPASEPQHVLEDWRGNSAHLPARAE